MKVLTVLFIFIAVECFAQGISLSKEEFCWAVFHPFAAIKVKKITAKANVIYSQDSIKINLDRFSSGGQLDAFRHVFYMAAFAQKIKIKKLRKLGIAHEKSNYRQFLNSKTEDGELPDSLSSVMDLMNNELGFNIGNSQKKIDRESLKKDVIERIKKGDATIMKRNKNGRYVDCSGNEIEPHADKKWSLPKCLVKSNHKP